MDIDGENIGTAGNVKIGRQNNYFGVNPTSLPNTIPSVSGFVGRDEYLKNLHESYKNGKCCFVLHGIGGVGKTALALKFASEIAKDFKAKIFVEMQGLSKTSYSARDAMFEVVRQFNPKISAKIKDSQLKGIFTQFVQEQNTLIVLDNAENKQSVESLIKANACFIVTTRQSFFLTGGKSIKVPKMSPEDAQRLLFEIAGEQRFDGRAGELASLAGLLPMALKPLASILAEDELETSADLIEKYRDKQKLLDEPVPDYDDLTVKASFELSYEKLSDKMKQNWRRLSVFPADFDEAAIASTLDISLEEAEETQQQLRQCSLLELNAETKRFNLHGLVRVFTNEKLSPNERFYTQCLFAEHYALLLSRLDEMNADNEENHYTKALKRVDTEWLNLVAGQKWAVEYIEKDIRIAGLVTDYSGYAREYTSLRLSPHKNIEWSEAGLKAARIINSPEDAGLNLGILGLAYHDLGLYEKAIECHKSALKISCQLDGRESEIVDLNNLGFTYNALGKFHEAIKYLEQAVEICREIDREDESAHSLDNLGVAYVGIKDNQKALEYYELGLSIARRYKDLFVERYILGNLGIYYFGLNEHQKAIENHKMALELSRKIGDKEGEGKNSGNLGECYFALNDKKEACRLWEEAVKILEVIESPDANIFQQLIEVNCKN